MQIDRILAADGVLSDLADLAVGIPEHRQDAVAMALQMQLTRSYLVEFAKHLSAGDEPYDALLKTARGVMPLPENPTTTTFRLLTAKPAPDPE